MIVKITYTQPVGAFARLCTAETGEFRSAAIVTAISVRRFAHPPLELFQLRYGNYKLSISAICTDQDSMAKIDGSYIDVGKIEAQFSREIQKLLGGTQLTRHNPPKSCKREAARLPDDSNTLDILGKLGLS